MRGHRPVLSLLLLIVASSTARSAPPASAPHVDPNAPCYRWPALDWDGDGVFDRIDRCNDTRKGCTVDEHGCPADADGDGVCDGLDRCPDTGAGMEVDEHGCAANQRATGRVQAPPPEPPREVARGAPKPVPTSKPVSESERQLVEQGRIRLENIYFETNSADLLAESEGSLREAGEALEKFADLRIEVEGHTDTRGTKRHNLRLSGDRAWAVRRWLLDHFRLQPDNLVAKGYGEERPETKERNDEELLRNRRVVLTVLNPEALPRGVKVQNQE